MPDGDAFVEDGIPLAQFAVDDIEAEHARLTSNGVVSTQPPTDIGTPSWPSLMTHAATLSSSSKPDENHDSLPATGPPYDLLAEVCGSTSYLSEHHSTQRVRYSRWPDYAARLSSWM